MRERLYRPHLQPAYLQTKHWTCSRASAPHQSAATSGRWEPGKAVAQSDSGTEEKDRRYKQVMAGEEWVLQFLSLLCGQTNVASGLNLSNWVCPLAEVWESLKKRAKWLNGSGESTLSLMGFTHSAPSGWSWGASALAALNCSWLQVPVLEELPCCQLFWGKEQEKEVAQGREWLGAEEWGRRYACRKTKPEPKHWVKLLCFLMSHVAARLLGAVLHGTGIYNYHWIQRVFRAFSKVAFILQGQRHVCFGLVPSFSSHLYSLSVICLAKLTDSRWDEFMDGLLSIWRE